MRIDVRVDALRMVAGLQQQRERLQRQARRAINAAAYQARDDLRGEMRRVFDRPTPWVLNSFYVQPARDTGGAAYIRWREFAGKGTPGHKILRAQVEGGTRRDKRFERLLRLPPNRQAVPGKWAELDAYGNIRASQIVKIISDLRLFGEVGYVANRNANRRSRGARRHETYFMIPVGRTDTTLPPGIYRYAQHLGGAPLLVIAFVRAARYRPRLAIRDTIRASVTRNLPRFWRQAQSGTLPFRTR